MHMHVVPAPNLRPVPKPTPSIAPKNQVRNERQVSRNSYNVPNAPTTKYSTAQTNSKDHLAIVPAPKPRTIVISSQSKPAPKQVRNERQVSPNNYLALASSNKKVSEIPRVIIPVASSPKSKLDVKEAHSIIPKQVRNERQVSSNNYNAPLSNYNPLPAADSYKIESSVVEAQPTTIEARQIAAPKQPAYKASGRARQPVAITRYLYNSPTGEEEEGDDVFNYEFESQNGIKQR